jgi:plasmid partitioning protein RepB
VQLYGYFENRRAMAQHRTKLAALELQAVPAPAPSVIRELDPNLVEPSFIADRMEATDESYRTLVASIAAQGQLIPILVRPHPEGSGGYQVAFGHRRLRAAAELGRPIRCMVKPLSDRCWSSPRARKTAPAPPSPSSSVPVSPMHWNSCATSGM